MSDVTEASFNEAVADADRAKDVLELLKNTRRTASREERDEIDSRILDVTRDLQHALSIIKKYRR